MSVRGKGSPPFLYAPKNCPRGGERGGKVINRHIVSQETHRKTLGVFSAPVCAWTLQEQKIYVTHICTVCAHPVHVYLKHVLCCGRTGGAWLLAPFFVPTLAMERLGKTESCLYCISLTRRVLFPLLQESTVPKKKGMLAAGTKQNSGAGSGYSANPQLPCYLHILAVTRLSIILLPFLGDLSLCPLSAFNLSQVERKRRRERAKVFCHQNFYDRSPYSSVGALIFFGKGKFICEEMGTLVWRISTLLKKSERREQTHV